MLDRRRWMVALAALPLLLPSLSAAYHALVPRHPAPPRAVAGNAGPSPTVTASPNGAGTLLAHDRQGWRCLRCARHRTRRIGSRRALPPVTDDGRLPPPARLYPHSLGSVFGVGSFVTQRSPGLAGMLAQRLRLLGAGWVREELTASVLHAGPRRPYRWGAVDRVVDRERAAGLQVLGLLDYSNTWGYRSHATMPRSDMHRLGTDFARYAAAVVRHFRGRISHWEVWNEPNIRAFWRPRPDPAAYAQLLTAADRAIKHADPHATVIMGGMSGVDLHFLYAVAARTHAFDAIAVHPYRVVPEDRLLRQIAALRRFHRPLWFTEIGWPAGSRCAVCTDEGTQAGDLVRFYALAAGAGVRHIFWYDLRDDLHSPGNPEGHFGLLRRDLAGKPAFAAFRFLVRALAGSRFVAPNALDRVGVYALHFQAATGPVVPLWNTAATDRVISVPWTAPTAALRSLDGDLLLALSPRNGRVTVRLPALSDPVYLLSAPLSPVSIPGPLLHPAHRRPAAHLRRVTRHAHPARRVQRGQRRRPARTAPRMARAAHPVQGNTSRRQGSPTPPGREQGIRVAPTRTPSPISSLTPASGPHRLPSPDPTPELPALTPTPPALTVTPSAATPTPEPASPTPSVTATPAP